MQRHYVGVIVCMLERLQHGCRGLPLRAWVNRPPDVSSRPKVFRHLIPRARGSTKSAAAACSLKGAGTIRSHHMESDTIQALMELALPQFGGLGDRSVQARKPWICISDGRCL